MSKIKQIKIGEVYNDFTVLDVKIKDHNINKRGFVALVRCKCGEICKYPHTDLRSGRSKRCNNCSFELREKSRKQVPAIDQIFNRLVVERSKKQNIEVSINSNDYEKIASENCYYCGDEPKINNSLSKRKYVNNKDIYLNGIDRLDPNKGYTYENCVSCCTSCNYSKHLLTEDEFKIKIMKIYKNLNLQECVLGL